MSLGRQSNTWPRAVVQGAWDGRACAQAVLEFKRLCDTHSEMTENFFSLESYEMYCRDPYGFRLKWIPALQRAAAAPKAKEGPAKYVEFGAPLVKRACQPQMEC